MKKQYDTHIDLVKDFFWVHGWKGVYAHRTLNLKFDKTRFISIELSTAGTHDCWEGFIVSMISKQRGTIAKQYFPFAQYLEPDRSTIQGEIKTVTHAWKSPTVNGGLEWYGPIPTDDSVQNMTDEIQAWLCMFNEETP